MQSDSNLKKIRSKQYYFLAHLGSRDLTHPAMRKLVNLAQNSKFILDLGCGEGTRISSLKEKIKDKNINWFGIDINEYAIKKAQQYPLINFTLGDLERLPYASDKFDLLFSAFVFEHLISPENVLKEAKRVLKKKGKFLIVAPNFGSPNRRSPNSRESKLIKLLKGLLSDFKDRYINKLNWKKVTPNEDEYTVDSDATIEPYLRTLKKYSAFLNFKIIYCDSLWGMDNFSFFQFPFKILGKLRVYPFYYWGPHLLIILKK